LTFEDVRLLEINTPCPSLELPVDELEEEGKSLEDDGVIVGCDAVRKVPVAAWVRCKKRFVLALECACKPNVNPEIVCDLLDE
jgi:hypothetical protein